MATKTTRLNDNSRYEIAEALLVRKFKPLFAALYEREIALAEQCYDLAYAKYKEAIATLPDGALMTAEHMCVNAGGQRHHLRLRVCRWGETYGGPERSVFAMWHNNGDVAPGAAFGLDHPMYEAISKLKQDMLELDDTVRKVNAQTRDAIWRFTSFEKLIAAWPEAEPVIQPILAKHQKASVNPVPAVLLHDLNKALGLPPEEGA